MNFLGHFKTITKHRHTVIKHCFKAGIFWQGLGHDLSKYTPQEFLAGAKNYQGTRSPNEVQREIYGYSPAWLHHKGRNKHHFEYWFDYNPKLKKIAPIKIPLKYVVEMFCDRVAASKVYRGKEYTPDHPLNYLINGKDTRYIHPETLEFLIKLLTMLKDEGEDKTFAYIRRKIKEKKEY